MEMNRREVLKAAAAAAVLPGAVLGSEHKPKVEARAVRGACSNDDAIKLLDKAILLADGQQLLMSGVWIGRGWGDNGPNSYTHMTVQHIVATRDQLKLLGIPFGCSLPTTKPMSLMEFHGLEYNPELVGYPQSTFCLDLDANSIMITSFLTHAVSDDIVVLKDVNIRAKLKCQSVVDFTPVECLMLPENDDGYLVQVWARLDWARLMKGNAVRWQEPDGSWIYAELTDDVEFVGANEGYFRLTFEQIKDKETAESRHWNGDVG